MRRVGGLLWLLLAVGAPSLAQETTSADPGRLRLSGAEHLPLQALLPTLARLELRRHALPQVALAYYQPQLALHPDGARPIRDSWRGQLWLRSGLEASHPQASVAGPLTRDEGGTTLLPLLAATPDVVEPLMYSLILAALHFRLDSEPAFGAQVDRFAASFGSSTSAADGDPADALSRRDGARAEVLMASASFGAHLLVLANEIQRAQERRLAAGKTGLCAQVRAGAGLFSLWEKAFSEAPFPVTTFDVAGAERTRDVSGPHRRWVVRTLFYGGSWSGTRQDHEALCP